LRRRETVKPSPAINENFEDTLTEKLISKLRGNSKLSAKKLEEIEKLLEQVEADSQVQHRQKKKEITSAESQTE